MDLKLLEYVVAIADYGNITKAAEAMFITQSGLNQQLIHLEKELNTPLFYRTKRHLHPTQAGQIYIDNAREILRIKKNTYSMIDDIVQSTGGEMTFGLSWEHGIDMFINIFPQFISRYPGITIQLFERTVSQQQAMLASGHLDLSYIMLTDKDKIDLEYIHLCEEEFLLGIPRSHPLAEKYGTAPDKPMATLDLRELKNEKFSLMFPASTQRSVIDPLFKEAGFVPDILCETSLNNALGKMTSAGLCCTIMPRAYARHHDTTAWFHIKGKPKWEWVVAYSSKTHLSQSAHYLIQLIVQFSREKEQQWIDEIAIAN